MPNHPGTPLGEDCTTCGQVHTVCTGHKNVDDDNPVIRPCRKPPRKGLRACQMHGGNSARARAAAERTLAEQKARKAMTTYGTPVDINAVDALLNEIKWTAGHVDWLRGKVAELDEDTLIWGKTRDKSGGQDFGTTMEAKPSVWHQMLMAERAHLVKVCGTAISAGIEERRVRIAEQQGQLVATVIRGILDDLSLTPDQVAQVQHVVPRHLRAIS